MATRKPSTPGTSLGKNLAVLGALFLLTVALQVANRSYDSEFGRDFDEAAHFVTGLMLHDFLVGLDWSSPLEYAEDYYLHYPKVALGHWPPVFYGVQAIWYLAFPPSRWSIMLLLAALGAVLGWMVWRSGARRFDWRLSLVFSALMLALPLSQSLYSVCMAEILLAILVLAATLAWGRYLDEPGWRWSITFSALAVLAILTKANALALTILPILSLLISRRWSLLKRASCWLPALCVLILCGPWYAMTLNMLSNGPLARGPRFWYTIAAVPRFSATLVDSAGLAITVAAVLAMIVVIGKSPGRAPETDGYWVSLTSSVLSIMIFHWIVPASFAARHLFIAIPPLMLLALLGLDLVARRAPRPLPSAASRMVALTLLAALLTTALVIEVPRRPWRGYGAIAELLTARKDLADSVVLVVSDSLGEGALITEVALREARPGHIVLRSSKALSRSSWDGSNYQLLFTDSDDLAAWLEQVPVGVLAIDESVLGRRRPPELDLLLETLDTHAERWQKLGEFDMIREGRSYPEALSLFVQKDHQRLPRSAITLDLVEMLGRHITGQGSEQVD